MTISGSVPFLTRPAGLGSTTDGGMETPLDLNQEYRRALKLRNPSQEILQLLSKNTNATTPSQLLARDGLFQSRLLTQASPTVFSAGQGSKQQSPAKGKSKLAHSKPILKLKFGTKLCDLVGSKQLRLKKRGAAFQSVGALKGKATSSKAADVVPCGVQSERELNMTSREPAEGAEGKRRPKKKASKLQVPTAGQRLGQRNSSLKFHTVKPGQSSAMNATRLSSNRKNLLQRLGSLISEEDDRGSAAKKGEPTGLAATGPSHSSKAPRKEEQQSRDEIGAKPSARDAQYLTLGAGPGERLGLRIKARGPLLLNTQKDWQRQLPAE